SMGVCASSGGMFNNYAIVQGVDHVVPVDMYLPGCPPRPEMLIDAILKLHDKVMHEPLGPRRQRAIEAKHAREGVPAVAPGALRLRPPAPGRVDQGGRGGARGTVAHRELDERGGTHRGQAMTSPAERGMFGVAGTGDTSGFGGLVRRRATVLDTPRPYGGYYD